MAQGVQGMADRARAHALGPGRLVSARTHLDARSVGREAGAVDAAGERRVRALWELGRAQSRELAARLRAAAEFYGSRGAAGATENDMDDADAADMAVAVALRLTTAQAGSIIADGHRAVSQYPRVLARLEAGAMAAEWFRYLLRATRDLSDEAHDLIDERVSAWELESIPVARFRRELRMLIAWVAVRVESEEPESPGRARGVRLLDVDPVRGVASLEVSGPIPEVLALSHRLDAAARAVQQAQRHALGAAGTGSDSPRIPYDASGAVASSGRASSLRELRYAILTRTVLDSDHVEIPAERFRLQVTVPMMTLLGAGDAPGVFEGEHPIPPQMARELAAGEPVWHRILTDPVRGIPLPARADAYRPTAQMREHLRLRHPVCAAPGCTRSSAIGAEIDHIEEFDHRAPDRGGATTLENLHILCWRHHQLKTSRRIDPERASPPQPGAPPGPPGPPAPPVPLARPGSLALPGASGPGKRPGREAGPPTATRWRIEGLAETLVEDNRDLCTTQQVAALEAAWRAFESVRQRRHVQRKTLQGTGREARHSGASDWAESPPSDTAVRTVYAGPPPF